MHTIAASHHVGCLFGAALFSCLWAGTACTPQDDTDTHAPTEVARITLASNLPVVGARDINGDGIDDLLISDSQAGSYPSTQGGEIYLLLGPVESHDLTADTPDLKLRGQEPYRHYGVGLAVGDLDGDSTPDIIIRADASEEHIGLICAVSGTLRGQANVESATFLRVQGPASLGQAMLCTDYDGDGGDDLLITCPAMSQIYVIRGPRTGTLTMPEDADAVLSTPQGALGWSMTVGSFMASGGRQLAASEPIGNVVYVLPTGALGLQSADETALATIRSADAAYTMRSIENVRIAGQPDTLSIRCRRADSEQFGTVFMLRDLSSGQLGLEASAYLTLRDTAVVFGVSCDSGPGPSGQAIVAMGVSATPQVPDSSLTGELTVWPAGLEGSYSMTADSLPGLVWRATAADTQIDWFGSGVLFGQVHQAGVLNLVVGGRGTVLIYAW